MSSPAACFSPGTVIVPQVGADIITFVSDSSWSEYTKCDTNAVALVIQVHKHRTGSGRRWHRILINTRLCWIEGPSGWEAV